MNLSDLLLFLQQSISAEPAARVLAALRRDPLVWSGLQREGVFQALVDQSSTASEDWQPGNLALRALGSGFTASQLAVEDLPALEKTIRQQALQVFEEKIRQNELCATLEEAGLVAIALRERRRVTKTWDGLGEELFVESGVPGARLMQVWQTPLACLYSMIPDGSAMRSQVMSGSNKDLAMRLVNHVLLSNPITMEDRIRQLLGLLGGLTRQMQSQWLRLLNLQGEVQMVMNLAQQLLGAHGLDALSVDDYLVDGRQSEDIFRTAVDLEHKSSLLRFAGDDEQALLALANARKLAISWMAGIHAQMAAIPSGDQADLPVEARNMQDAELAHGPVQKLMEQTVSQAKAGEREEAIESARKAVGEWIGHYSMGLEEPAPRNAITWSPSTYVHTLMDLGLDHEALQLCLLLLQSRPADLELIDLAAELLLNLGNLEQALDYTRMAIVLDPEGIGRHRRLAEIYERCEMWRQAFEVRQYLNSQLGVPVLEDRLAYLVDAVNCGESTLALQQGLDLLEQYPNHGAINGMVGDAYYRLENWKEAARYYGKATLLQPTDAVGWMRLADCYERMDEPLRALETLRAAILSAPNSTELNYRLATTCLAFNLYSEALPFLKRAASLTPESYEVTTQLANTLFSLGQMEEVSQVLETARQNWPSDSELAYLEGRVLLNLGDEEAAVRSLEVALQTPTPDFDRLMLYAETLCSDWRRVLMPLSQADIARLVNAQQAVGKALAIRPDDFEARLLLAEIQGMRGNWQSAAELYSTLVEDARARDMEWRWRVQSGWGRAALETGQTAAALAALEEAAMAHPDSVYLQRLMCEAYMAAELPQEAMQAARYAHRLAPSDLDTLTWFAGVAIQLGADWDAVDALQCATQLAPDNPDYWLRLIGLHLQLGELDSAKAGLLRLMDLTDLSPDHLRQAAYCYLRMQETGLALSCLQQAVSFSSNPSAGLLFEIAQLMAQMGQLEDALQVTQNAIQNSPEAVNFHVFQADLLTALGRTQAAFACLEQAVQIRSGNPSPVQIEAEDWISSLEDSGAIYLRFGCLMRRMGNLAEAVEYFQSALKEHPDNIGLRVVTSSLYLHLNDIDQAKQTIDSLSGDRLPDTIEDAWKHWVALRVEMALDDGDTGTALQILQNQVGSVQDHPRLLLDWARLLARSGETMKAAETMARALTSLPDVTDESAAYYGPLFNFKFDPELWLDVDLWVSRAAYEVGNWLLALQSIDLASRKMTTSALLPLEQGRLRIHIAEQQRLRHELEIVRRLPGDESLAESEYGAVQAALSRAEHLGNNVKGWKARCEAAFHPGPASVRSLAETITTADDAAALIMVLRGLGNTAAAMQVASQVEETPEILTQLALACCDNEVERGIEYATRLMEIQPNHAINHVVMARLHEKAGDMDAALADLEHALALWQDEAAWQAWAARISMEIQLVEKAIAHFEQAVHFAPDNRQYALQLSRIYLLEQMPRKALDLLNRAEYQENEEAEYWFLLGQAFWQAGEHQEALVCGEKAAAFDVHDPKPYLLCGMVALELGKLELAHDYAHKALLRDPDNAESILMLVQVLTHQQRQGEALEVLDEYSQLVETDLPLMLEKARLIHQIQGGQAALPLLRQLADRDPQNMAVLSMLAQTEAAFGQTDRAKSVLHTALRLDPVQPDLNLLMGRLQHNAGQLDQAVHYLSEAIRQSPVGLDAYLELGRTHQERREDAQALKIYQQAIRIAPNDQRAYYEAAMILRESKDYAGAEEMLRRAAKIAPDDLNIRRQLGAMIALNLVNNAQEVNTSR